MSEAKMMGQDVLMVQSERADRLNQIGRKLLMKQIAQAHFPNANLVDASAVLHHDGQVIVFVDVTFFIESVFHGERTPTTNLVGSWSTPWTDDEGDLRHNLMVAFLQALDCLLKHEAFHPVKGVVGSHMAKFGNYPGKLPPGLEEWAAHDAATKGKP